MPRPFSSWKRFGRGPKAGRRGRGHRATDARGQRGATIVEALVSVGIVTLALSTIAGGVFQALGVQRTWRGDAVAVRELRAVGSAVATDALNATALDLAVGAPPTGSVTIQWTDNAGAPHTATYRQVGATLEREFDGETKVIASQVLSAAFSRTADDALRLTLLMEAGGGDTKSVSLETYLRMLTP